MLAFAEIAPERQLEWTRVALEVAERSKQENARKWRASLNNNLGYALHQSKKFEDALLHFERALELRQQQGNAQNIRIAKWMIAWSLRFLSRQTEAIAMQEQLEMECAQAGEPDVHVFNELATLHANAGTMQKPTGIGSWQDRPGDQTFNHGFLSLSGLPSCGPSLRGGMTFQCRSPISALRLECKG